MKTPGPKDNSEPLLVTRACNSLIPHRLPFFSSSFLSSLCSHHSSHSCPGLDGSVASCCYGCCLSCHGSTWEAVTAHLLLVLWSHVKLSGSTSLAAATLLLFLLGLLTPSCASALQSVSCSADGCPAASGYSAMTAAADPLTPLLFPAHPVLPNVGKDTPRGRSRFLCPVLQNEGGNTDRCLLSNSPSEHTADLYSQRKGVCWNHSQPPMQTVLSWHQTRQCPLCACL